MHVLVMPSWFEDSRHPTLGSFFKDQAIALHERGHKVGIIYPNAFTLKSPQYFELAKIYYIGKGDLPVYTQSYFTIPMFRQLNIRRRIAHYLRLFERYIKEHGQPDVLHAHSCALGPSGSAGLAARHIAKKYHIPYVITEHGSAFHTGYYQQVDIGPIKDAFEHARHVLVVSNSLLQDLRDFGVKRELKVLGNIVDVDTFKPLSFTPANSDVYIFIAIAYLRPIKQIDILIKAFAKVHQENPVTTLQIVGDGEQKYELEALSRQLNIADSVEFYGELPRAQVASFLGNADCLVLTSQYETFAVVVHEALAAGKPVISFSCGGPEPTLLALGETVLSNQDEDELAIAMLEKSKTTETLEQSQQRSNYIVSNFSSEAIGKQLERYLIDAINETSHSC
jgi:glycosyltransferase involved in cell wall biosynthesis